MLAWDLGLSKISSCSLDEGYGIESRDSCVWLKRRMNMPRGREKDREMRRKHRKNQRRVKSLETTRREKGKKK
jgi:hypothetical protein